MAEGNSGKNREEILMQLLTGDLDAEQGEGRKMLDEDPALKNEYEEMRELTQQLDQVGAEEADAIDALPDELPPSATVDEALEENWKDEGGKATSKDGKGFSLFQIGLLAAACLVLFFVGKYILYEDKSDPIQYLGQSLVVTSPQGEVPRYTFAWQEFDLPLGGRFVLIIDKGIHSKESRGPEEYWQGSETVAELTPEQLASLPDRIEWWVEAFGPNDFDPIARSKAIFLKRAAK